MAKYHYCENVKKAKYVENAKNAKNVKNMENMENAKKQRKYKISKKIDTNMKAKIKKGNIIFLIRNN